MAEKQSDGVSTGMMRFLDGLSPTEREELTEALRDPSTYFAEDLDDLLAVLKHIEAEKAKAEQLN